MVAMASPSQTGWKFFHRLIEYWELCRKPGLRIHRLLLSERRVRLDSMSTPASCLLSRLLAAHRRAASPPLGGWPVWPETRAERGTFDILVAQGLLVENGSTWLLTERAMSPAGQLAAAENQFLGLLRAAPDLRSTGKWTGAGP